MTQSSQYHDLEVDDTIYRREDGPFAELFEELRKERFKNFASPPKPRKRSIRKLIEQAKAAGATTITLPDGTKLELGKIDSPKQGNEVDEWMAKHARAPERHS